MRSIGVAIVIGVATLSSACTRVAVYVEHDPRIDFTTLTTYDWAEPAPDTTAPEPDLDARVRAIVKETLDARGFEPAAQGETADFLLACTAAVDESVRSVTIDRYYGYKQSAYLSKSGTARSYPRATARRQTAVRTYRQGSLILDILMSEPRRRIWRAYARAVIDPDETDAQREQRLRQAVREMLEQFPPR
jgi:hypothetical protein